MNPKSSANCGTHYSPNSSPATSESPTPKNSSRTTSHEPGPPWADSLFRLLVHAESQRLAEDDVGRRMALIDFDNAIEVAITTYLRLNPENRGGRAYKRDDVAKWLKNYHEKLRFLEAELTARNLPWKVEKSHIIWAHDARNDHYHGTAQGVPEKKMIEVAREAAYWIFGLLFEVDHVDILVQEEILGPVFPPAEKIEPAEAEAEPTVAVDLEVLPKSKAGQSEFTESVVEEAALSWFEMLGYTTASGPTLSGEADAPATGGRAWSGTPRARARA